MATPEDLVRRFYAEVWDRADEEVASEILAPDFRFRGSLGPEKRGVDGFVTYLRDVHAALEGFRCIVEHLVVSPPHAAARMRFAGRHRAPLFGVDATGRQIDWAGAAFFEMTDTQIASLWVLGDVDGVKRQLGAPGATLSEAF